ncbi:Thyroid adenoma-associated protein-like [Papilio machaon]|uniref:Thyroid adenoma-associated protein-like n=1 Tax=Papilio machaon TaxID=76193 RepID=A0A194RIA5_PAPMA|nr:Thyroid adenoma-associated protein-like [Papilio machaon]
MKGNLAFNPVVIPPHLINKIVDGHTLFEKFNQSNSVDEQLLILRENLNNHCNEKTLHFLVLIFLQTEIKHPIKCFVVRYITKNDHLQEPFSKALAEEISKHFSVDNIEYKVYNDFIPKLASCIENFPSGAQAIKLVEARLTAYLIQCLCCCVHTLSSKKTLSPTEKNEIFDLTHLTLRLLLHIVQKIGNKNCTELMSHFNAIKLNIKELLFDDDVPMDSKSVCGILFLTMYILENGLKSWCEVLNPSGNNQEFSELLCNNSARLSLHSALATVISAEDLCTTTIGDQHALLLLTDNILAIGEKMSSDSTFTLGVTRTLVQISRTLLKCQSQLGLRLVDSLLVFVWAHLEHYMDSVRHLTAQVLGHIVKYCTHLKDKGEEKALEKLLTAILSLDKSRKSYYVSVRCLSEELGAGHVLSRLPAALRDLLAALDLQTVQACMVPSERLDLDDGLDYICRTQSGKLLFDDDVPMDSKSVCGILFLTMYILENGLKSWCEILNPSGNNQEFSELLCNDSARLSLHSALATVISAEDLCTTTIGDQHALLLLTDNILAIGENRKSYYVSVRCLSEELGAGHVLSRLPAALRDLLAALDLQTVQACATSALESLLQRHSRECSSAEMYHIWVQPVLTHLTHNHLHSSVLNILENLLLQAVKLDRNILDYLLPHIKELPTSNENGREDLKCVLMLLSVVRKSNAVGKMMEKEGEWKGLIGYDVLKMAAVNAVDEATSALESLLQRHSRECSSAEMYHIWVQPVLTHLSHNHLHSSVLNILENLLLQAVKLDDNILDYLLPHIKELPTSNENGREDLKCVLMLLSVVRKSNAVGKVMEKEGEWKGLIGYDVLKMAAVNAVDETRILTLSLVVESPKSTESFSVEELYLVLWYLRYNINAQAPNLRQLTLSLMKKFMKRLEDSYKVLKRQNAPNGDSNKSDYYLTFLEDMREFCYKCLVTGANYSRRYVALQLLDWTETTGYEGYHRTWKSEYIDNLLQCLDDSYESNKVFALEILQTCPQDLLESQRIVAGMDMESILSQTSSMKPPDCVSAAYKLRLFVARFPHILLQGYDTDVPECVRHAALRRLLHALAGEVRACERSVVRAARHAHMYGALHCMLHILQHVDTR